MSEICFKCWGEVILCTDSGCDDEGETLCESCYKKFILAEE